MRRALLVLLGVAAVAAPGAHAAYPGANGKLVYFQEEVGGTEPVGLAVSSANGREQVDIGPRCAGEGLDRVPGPCPADPQWSPDGTVIAFALGNNIGIINPDGTGFRRLAPATFLSAIRSPTWSPDGARLAFSAVSSLHEDGRHVWEVRADGTRLRRLTLRGQADQPAWSERNEIAFVRAGNIEVLNPDALGAGPIRVTSRGGARPTWSPSGRTIAFVRKVKLKRTSKRRTPVLYRVTERGRKLRRLTKARAEDPSWRPDGSGILFERFDGGNSIILSVDPLGRRTRFVTGGFEGRRNGVSQPDQQPR